MNISKYTLITMNKINISVHRMSPREDCSVDFKSPEGDISQKLNPLELDSFHLVKNVPRVHLPQRRMSDDDGSESEFDDFEEDSAWFATYVQDIAHTNKGSSSISSRAQAAPVKRRSSVKHTVPLKKATITLRRNSGKTGGNRINRLLNKMKRTTRKQDMRELVRDAFGRDSLHLARNRMQCSKNATKSTQ
ncbi:MAG: hypothetical protein SGBAC_006758 [Bacillariaceae sp.]